MPYVYKADRLPQFVHLIDLPAWIANGWSEEEPEPAEPKPDPAPTRRRKPPDADANASN